MKSIEVSNFRSIKGSVTIPLDAPVVLVHGQNGAGKTSLLSAIELGLTGEVSSLARLDRGYVTHLVHKEADYGRVAIVAEGLEDADSVEILVDPEGSTGGGLLFKELAGFYSERCYLAQATLSRLLEIYEGKETRKSDSSLTLFVKDLLGLDRLDALIDGLHDAGDVRRLRGALPVFRESYESISRIREEIAQQSLVLAQLNDAIKNRNHVLLERLGQIGVPATLTLPDSEFLKIFESRPEDPKLQHLARHRRDLIAIGEQWQAIQTTVDIADFDKAEQAVRDTSVAVEAWKASTGKVLENLLVRLGEFFPDLMSLQAAGPARAYEAALRQLVDELERCASVLAREAENTVLIEKLDGELGRAKTRAAELDEQIAGHAAHAGSLVKVLAQMLSHTDSEQCPVCGRDFSEISEVPLYSHLSNRIAELTESAGRLEVLNVERTGASRNIAEAERQREGIVAQLMPTVARDEMKSRRASLEELHRALTNIASASVGGDPLIAAAAASSQHLNELRSRDRRAIAIRASAAQLALDLGLETIGEAESTQAALARIESHASRQEAMLLTSQLARRHALEDLQEKETLTTRRSAVENFLATKKNQAAWLTAALEKSDRRMLQARELGHRVRAARTEIVRRVFNESLNKVWRDLFIRLAPDEPFIPGFALPDTQHGSVEAVLETTYRSGGKGGNPRTMLSTGNLNTAALTLFLALHLSVKPALPWLVIDDPVQNMDEVHIAQFAALLRTLSKQHGRQIIITVHEKPLFDYLALELSPAFQDDRLIKIEISRSASGDTIATDDLAIWTPDTAIAA